MLASSAAPRALCDSAVTVMNWLFSPAFALTLPLAAALSIVTVDLRSATLACSTTTLLIRAAWLPPLVTGLRALVFSAKADSAPAPRYTCVLAENFSGCFL